MPAADLAAMTAACMKDDDDISDVDEDDPDLLVRDRREGWQRGRGACSVPSVGGIPSRGGGISIKVVKWGRPTLNPEQRTLIM